VAAFLPFHRFHRPSTKLRWSAPKMRDLSVQLHLNRDIISVTNLAFSLEMPQ
jgi:hypothetical protein